MIFFKALAFGIWLSLLLLCDRFCTFRFWFVCDPEVMLVVVFVDVLNEDLLVDDVLDDDVLVVVVLVVFAKVDDKSVEV